MTRFTSVRSVTRGVLAVLIAAAIVACSDSSGPAGNTEFAGSYSLASVNGSAVPVVVQQTLTEKDEVLSGSGDVNQNGTFNFTVNVRATIFGVSSTQQVNFGGTWTRSGNSFVFKNSDGSMEDGVYSNRAMTVTAASLGVTLVFNQI